jgi:hypothetical protein
MTSILIRERREDTADGHMKMETGFRIMQAQGQKKADLPKTGRGKSYLSRGSGE